MCTNKLHNYYNNSTWTKCLKYIAILYGLYYNNIYDKRNDIEGNKMLISIMDVLSQASAQIQVRLSSAVNVVGNFVDNSGFLTRLSINSASWALGSAIGWKIIRSVYEVTH